MSFDQPLPLHLSPSRLSDFQACPRRYQHASVDRIPQPASYASAKGRFVHFIFERLMLAPASDRTRELALSFVPLASEEILTPDVRADISMDEALESRLLSETEAIVTVYFEMENPALVTTVDDGIELKLRATVDGAPLLGILDRLDRDADGSLVIVDYKTGSVPNRQYDAQTFANAELYAVLCEEALGERPSRIRLLYVAKGEVLERTISPVVVKARAEAASRAWRRIEQYYNDGDFPATPSSNACRFCSFKDLCRSNGVAVAAR